MVNYFSYFFVKFAELSISYFYFLQYRLLLYAGKQKQVTSAKITNIFSFVVRQASCTCRHHSRYTGFVMMKATVLDNYTFGAGHCLCQAAYFQACSYNTHWYKQFPIFLFAF